MFWVRKRFFNYVYQKKKNRSGTTSIVVAEKTKGSYKELVTIGIATDVNDIDSLVNDGAEMSSIYKVNQINPLSMKEKKALLELLYGYMTEETEEMRITEVEVPDLYKSLINDMINFEIIKRSYCYICTALDKDIVKGDVNDGQ